MEKKFRVSIFDVEENNHPPLDKAIARACGEPLEKRLKHVNEKDRRREFLHDIGQD